MTATIMVAHMLRATGRARIPSARRPDPAICVPAALSVQKDAGPGKKPKNLATTFFENPSTFWTLSNPWWIMSAHVPIRRAVRNTSVAGSKNFSWIPGSSKTGDSSTTSLLPPKKAFIWVTLVLATGAPTREEGAKALADATTKAATRIRMDNFILIFFCSFDFDFNCYVFLFMRRHWVSTEFRYDFVNSASNPTYSRELCFF
mmetsp:Transcript_24878/g.58380  ORF Transcript_24878/g.58380 Transcript_24878/m.58380 type:complete len:203 (+) Transcript_24878:257-865(+)